MLNDVWILEDSKGKAFFVLDYLQIESLLVDLWKKRKGEDTTQYQGLYLFFDSSLNATFTKEEVEKNFLQLLELLAENQQEPLLQDRIKVALKTLQDKETYRPLRT